MTDDKVLLCRHHIRSGLAEAQAWMHELHDHLEHPTLRSRLAREIYRVERMRDRLELVGESDRPRQVAEAAQDGGEA